MTDQLDIVIDSSKADESVEKLESSVQKTSKSITGLSKQLKELKDSTKGKTDVEIDSKSAQKNLQDLSKQVEATKSSVESLSAKLKKLKTDPPEKIIIDVEYREKGLPTGKEQSIARKTTQPKLPPGMSELAATEKLLARMSKDLDQQSAILRQIAMQETAEKAVGKAGPKKSKEQEMAEGPSGGAAKEAQKITSGWLRTISQELNRQTIVLKQMLFGRKSKGTPNIASGLSPFDRGRTSIQDTSIQARQNRQIKMFNTSPDITSGKASLASAEKRITNLAPFIPPQRDPDTGRFVAQGWTMGPTQPSGLEMHEHMRVLGNRNIDEEIAKQRRGRQKLFDAWDHGKVFTESSDAQTMLQHSKEQESINKFWQNEEAKRSSMTKDQKQNMYSNMFGQGTPGYAEDQKALGRDLVGAMQKRNQDYMNMAQATGKFEKEMISVNEDLTKISRQEVQDRINRRQESTEKQTVAEQIRNYQNRASQNPDDRPQFVDGRVVASDNRTLAELRKTYQPTTEKLSLKEQEAIRKASEGPIDRITQHQDKMQQEIDKMFPKQPLDSIRRHQRKMQEEIDKAFQEPPVPIEDARNRILERQRQNNLEMRKLETLETLPKTSKDLSEEMIKKDPIFEHMKNDKLRKKSLEDYMKTQREAGKQFQDYSSSMISGNHAIVKGEKQIADFRKMATEEIETQARELKKQGRFNNAMEEQDYKATQQQAVDKMLQPYEENMAKLRNKPLLDMEKS